MNDEQIFDRAIQLGAGDRDAFLNSACETAQRRDRVWRVRLRFLILVSSLVLMKGLSLADTCMRSSLEEGISTDGRFHVVVELDRNPFANQTPWQFEWNDQKTGQMFRGNIDQIDIHAHLTVLVADDGTRFAIADLSAGHRYHDRILLFQSDGRLIRSLGIADVLLFHERGDINHTVSHTSWVGYDEERKSSIWMSDDGRGIQLLTKSNTEAMISWDDGSVTREPWTMRLLGNAPLIWFALSGCLLLAMLAFARKPGDLRLALALWSLAAVLLGGAIWWLWRSEYFVTARRWDLYRSAVLAVLGIALIWLALGRSRWPLKLAMMVFCVSTLLVEMRLSNGRQIDLPTQIVPFMRTSGAFGLGMLLLLGVARWHGYRLEQRLTQQTSNEDRSLQSRFGQFRIRDLLIFTCFTAFFATAVRLHRLKEMGSHPEFSQYLSGLLWSFFAIAITWTVLTSSHWVVVRCSLILIALVAAITYVPEYPIRRGFDHIWWRSNLYLLVMLLPFLLVMRSQRYRITASEISQRNASGML
jgi:hypothetical protein